MKNRNMYRIKNKVNKKRDLNMRREEWYDQ